MYKFWKRSMVYGREEEWVPSCCNPIKGNMQWEEGGGYIARYLYPSNEMHAMW